MLAFENDLSAPLINNPSKSTPDRTKLSRRLAIASFTLGIIALSLLAASCFSPWYHITTITPPKANDRHSKIAHHTQKIAFTGVKEVVKKGSDILQTYHPWQELEGSAHLQQLLRITLSFLAVSIVLEALTLGLMAYVKFRGNSKSHLHDTLSIYTRIRVQNIITIISKLIAISFLCATLLIFFGLSWAYSLDNNEVCTQDNKITPCESFMGHEKYEEIERSWGPLNGWFMVMLCIPISSLSLVFLIWSHIIWTGSFSNY